MHSGTAHITLLAFVVSVKDARQDSLIFNGEVAYKICHEFGCAANTFKKYMQALDDLGLIHHTKTGHAQIISLSTCIRVLVPELSDDKAFSAFRYVRFFKGVESRPKSVKEWKQQIELAILHHNEKQQQYNIRRNSKVKELLNRPFQGIKPSVYKALLKKYNVSSAQELVRLIEKFPDYAVTGQLHLSKLLHVSPKTACNRLRIWSALQLIYRKIRYRFIPGKVCHALSDAIKAQYGYCKTDKERKGYWITLGSEVRVKTGGEIPCNGNF